MKKLFLLTTSFPFGVGEDSFINPELAELAKLFEVTVIATESLTEERNHSAVLPGGVTVKRVTSSSLVRLFDLARATLSPIVWREFLSNKRGRSRAVSFAQAVKYYAGSLRCWRYISDIVAKNGCPDIIYSFWHRPALLGVLLHKDELGNPKIIARAHGFDLYEEQTKNGYQPFMRKCDPLLDAMFLVSQAGYDYYSKHFSVSQPIKHHIAYLGCADNQAVRYEQSKVMRIFSCSYLIPRKRIHLIIEALSLITDRPVRWVHAGGGELEEELKALAAKKLPQNIEWEILGMTPNEKIRLHLYEMPYDCYLTTSEREGGVQVAAVEAASFGIPVIGTDSGGIPEIVNSSTGILLPADPTPEEIADALIRIKDMPREEYMSMRAAARALWEEKFCASANAKRFTERIVKMTEEG